jgi:hypothetical protein
MGVSYHQRKRHWKTEVVAVSLEMLSGRKKKDYAAEALAAQGNALDDEPADGIADGAGAGFLGAGDPDAEELEVAVA